MNRLLSTTALLLLSSIALLAQEKIIGLDFNPQIINKYQSAKKTSKAFRAEASTIVTLPFFDDFSDLSVWPSSNLWADNYAFINADFAKNAPTIGVATLDAIDETGSLYPNAGPNQFESDFLTSQPIRLDSILFPVTKAIEIKDSVYLSFYYQPQGRGSMPSAKDSLVLQFHSPIEIDTIEGENGLIIKPKWRTVWSSAGGISVDSFAVLSRHYFKQVLIPIIDSALYFKKGFQFRFFNYASLASNYVPDWQSNGDQWNIDMVFLNTGRNRYDTSFLDVAFADRAPSMLKNYESMPYRQYKQNYIEEMKDSLDIKIANLDRYVQNVSYKYFVQKDSNPPFQDYDGGSYSINPYSSNGYVTYQPFAHPPMNALYSPTEPEDKIAYHTIHVLTADPSTLQKKNDTIRMSQILGNFYAYDDGTAEAGVGINGSSGSYAVKFVLNAPDSLQAIQLYLNQVLTGNADEYIDLTVWNDNSGKPGDIIKQITSVTPLYSDSLNSYHTYWFDNPLFMDATNFPGLIFYVGWQQTSINNINIGLDRYNDTHQYRFYNVTGDWQMSDELHAGSVMIRPIVGVSNPVGERNETANDGISIYPNPATGDALFLKFPASWGNVNGTNTSLQIINQAGQVIDNLPLEQSIPIRHLKSGIYFLRVLQNEGQNISYLKFVVLR